MIQKILAAIVFSMSLMFSQLAFADHHKCKCWGDKMKEMTEKLNLTDEQKDKMKPMMEQLKTQMQDTRSQMKDIKMQLNEQVKSETMDQSKVDSLIDQKTKLMGDRMKAKYNMKNKMYNMLTPEQKAMADDWKQKMKQKWEERKAQCEAQCKNHDNDENDDSDDDDEDSDE